MSETWLPISGYEGRYEVSDLGRVRSLDRWVANSKTSRRLLSGQIIAPFLHTGGYAVVKLSRARSKVNLYIHRLVAGAFLPASLEREVLHQDGDKMNNAATNLRWGSRAENVADRFRLGEVAQGERHGMAKLSEAQVRAVKADPREHAPIALEYGVSRSLVSMIKRGRIWAHLTDTPAS